MTAKARRRGPRRSALTRVPAWLALAGFVVSGFVVAGIYPLAINWFGVASPIGATDFATVLLAGIVPLFLGAFTVSLLWTAKAECPSWKAGSGWGVVAAFVAFWANIIRGVPFLTSLRASVSIVVVGLVGGLSAWAISWWLLRPRSSGEPRKLKPWHLGIAVVVVGLVLAVTSGLLALGGETGSGTFSPSMTVVGQQGDVLAGYKLHLEPVLAARAVIVATSSQRIAAHNESPTRPLTASDLVVDELNSLLNRVRTELPVPPDEPLRSLDAAWRSGILHWFQAEQALASQDSQKNRDAEQQAMDEEHSAVQALTKYLAESMTAPPTTTATGAAPTTMETVTLKVDKAKFTAVWRALMKIEEATSVGVGYNDLRSLVQDFAAEISLLPRSVSDDERSAAVGLLNIAQAYNDSLDLWKAQVDFSKSDPYKSGLIPYVTAEASWVTKYGLTFVPGDKTKLTSDGIERVWSWAREKADELRSTLAP